MKQETAERQKTVHKEKRRLPKIIYGRILIILISLLLQIVLLLAVMLSLMEKVPAVFGGVVVFTAVMLVYILNIRANPSVKLSWCVVIAVLPVFGTVLYLFFHLDLGHRVEQRILQKTVDESRVYIADASACMEQLRQEDKNVYNLAVYLENNGFPVFANTDVQYFPVGEDMFEQMLIQLEKAERFIFLEYFSIAYSYMWDRILEILVRKAAEGVEVRVMYDGSCAVSYLPYDYPRQLAEMGIQSKMFSPFRPFVSTHYNNRDHRKIMVIDGNTAFTGGINILDRYINRKQVFGHWKDTAVMLQGEGVRSFTLMFLQMWNSTEQKHIYEPYLEPVVSRQTQGYVIPYGDSPMDRQNVGEMVYLNIINQARDYVYIMTPYLILDNEMVTALQMAALRGVDVRLVLPHIPDKKYAFALAKNHYPELIEAGVHIFEYTPGFVHAKVFLSDDAHAVVGTINLDYRSLYLHFECAAYLYRLPVLQDIRRDFEDTFAKSQKITWEDVKKRSFVDRIVGAVLKIAAPLM